MAYFECTIGGASGDGVSLIVECDPSFAGSVITADNGEDSFSDTCPSVAPYTVRFEGIPTGTYTISGVSQGQTFTTQFTVLDYETTLNAIPDGATVTPVNNIQIWLHCANIWDKNYTSISQVLADASTLQALIASNNAADYMARSTSWTSSVTANANAMTYIGANNYCANTLLANSTWCTAICNSTYFERVLNVKVPTMTGYNTPSGQVVYIPSTSWSSGREPWRAFANSVAMSNATAVVTRVAYGFTQNVRIYKATGLVGPSGGYSYDVTVSLKASNNSDFSNVAFQSDKSVSLTSGNYTQVDFNGVNSNGVSAKYWGYEIPNSYTMSYNTLQFYGRA